MKPKIAICAKPNFPLEDTFDIARNNGYVAIDWTVELDSLSRFKKNRLRLNDLPRLRQGQEVRYHCPLGAFEIAHVNPYIAKNSVKLIKNCMDMIRYFDARYLTLHIGGAGTIEQLSWDAAVRNLTELVEYGGKCGIKLCLENLKSGWTSDPVLFCKLIKSSGAGVTFDIGHANSSVYAVSGQATCLDFLGEVQNYLFNAHIYEAEDPYHIAPEDLGVIGPTLKALMGTPCDWWVVELDDPESVEKTRSLLEDFVNKN
jgi:sugar phosphate isomerase/epimerase